MAVAAAAVHVICNSAWQRGHRGLSATEGCMMGSLAAAAAYAREFVHERSLAGAVSWRGGVLGCVAAGGRRGEAA